jgi:hypothetical protein
MAKALSFSQVEYRGKGNQVVCVIKGESPHSPERASTAPKTSPDASDTIRNAPKFL